MAIGITANLLLALFSSFLWQLSILYSQSQRSWVYGCRKYLLFCHHLLTTVIFTTIVGVGVGLFNKFYPSIPELVICLTFYFSVIGNGIYRLTELISYEAPLEYYHVAFWFKALILPFAMVTKRERERVKEAAKQRAAQLKEKAYKERAMIAPPDDESKPVTLTEVGALLRLAADQLGRQNFDTSTYEDSLEEDWYTTVDQLRDLTVNILDHYMPRALAQKVFSLLREEERMSEASGVDVFHDAAWEK